MLLSGGSAVKKSMFMLFVDATRCPKTSARAALFPLRSMKMSDAAPLEVTSASDSVVVPMTATDFADTGPVPLHVLDHGMTLLPPSHHCFEKLHRVDCFPALLRFHEFHQRGRDDDSVRFGFVVFAVG